MKLIDKDALVSEIEKLYNGEIDTYTRNILDRLKSNIDTLEVKEVQEESVSEDLEEEIDNYVKRNGYDGLDSIEEVKYIANHFAEWQKQQMMKDAVDAKVTARWPLHSSPLYNSYEMYVPYAQHLSEGDKVKLIIIKED